jgi:hypothetical protein
VAPTGEPWPAGLGSLGLAGLVALVIDTDAPPRAGEIIVAEAPALRSEFPGALRGLEHPADMFIGAGSLPAVLPVDSGADGGTSPTLEALEPLGTRATLARGQTRRRPLFPIGAEEPHRTRRRLVQPTWASAPCLTEQPPRTPVLPDCRKHLASLTFLPLTHQRASTKNGSSTDGLERHTGKAFITLLVRLAGAVQTHLKRRATLDETTQLRIAVRVRMAFPPVGRKRLLDVEGQHLSHPLILSGEQGRAV